MYFYLFKISIQHGVGRIIYEADILTNSKLDGWGFGLDKRSMLGVGGMLLTPFSSFVQTRLDSNAHLTLIATTIKITLLQLKLN
jgi:hypothetical protein